MNKFHVMNVLLALILGLIIGYVIGVHSHSTTTPHTLQLALPGTSYDQLRIDGVGTGVTVDCLGCPPSRHENH